jgi:hypothetical protein
MELTIVHRKLCTKKYEQSRCLVWLSIGWIYVEPDIGRMAYKSQSTYRGSVETYRGR